MKIVMLTPYFYPHTGGTEKYVKDLSIGLVQAGHEVTVISNNVPIRAKAPAEEVMQGVRIKRLPAFDFFYLPISLPFNLKLVEDFDIIHAHAPAFSFVRSVGDKVKTPLVLTYHCDTVAFDKIMGIPIPGFIRTAFEESFNAYARLWLPKVDAIISTTESYASTSHVLKDFPHYVVPIGVHYENFDPVIKKLGITEEKRLKNQVLFVGRLAANKGVEYLIRAVPKILTRFPDTKFIIAGEGEEKPHLLTLIKLFKVEEAITFFGTVTFEKLIELYTTSTVFVLPSINRLEAFGIVQLEAMACSTPVVVSNIPGVKEVAGEGGFLAEPKDPDSLAEAICKILSNREKAREMGRHARMLVEKRYNWKIIVERIVEIYKGVIRKKA